MYKASSVNGATCKSPRDGNILPEKPYKLLGKCQWSYIYIKIHERCKNSLWCRNYLQVWAIFLHVDRFLTFFRLEACSPLVQILSYQPFLAAQFLQFFQIELLLRDQLYWPELIVLHVLRYLTLQLHKPKIIQIICISNMLRTSQKVI